MTLLEVEPALLRTKPCMQVKVILAEWRSWSKQAHLAKPLRLLLGSLHIFSPIINFASQLAARQFPKLAETAAASAVRIRVLVYQIPFSFHMKGTATVICIITSITV